MFALYHAMLSDNLFPDVENHQNTHFENCKENRWCFCGLDTRRRIWIRGFLLPGIPARIRPVLILLSAHATKKKQVSEQDLEHLIFLTIELLWAAVLVHDLTLGKSGVADDELLVD